MKKGCGYDHFLAMGVGYFLPVAGKGLFELRVLCSFGTPSFPPAGWCARGCRFRGGVEVLDFNDCWLDELLLADVSFTLLWFCCLSVVLSACLSICVVDAIDMTSHLSSDRCCSARAPFPTELWLLFQATFELFFLRLLASRGFMKPTFIWLVPLNTL